MSEPVAKIEAAYQEHGSALLSYLRCMAGSAADDLLQETFVEAIRGANRFAQVVSPRAWLFAIARNVAITARRRLRLHAALPDDCAANEPESDPRLDAMRAAIVRLPDEQRETLELRLRDELSYEEIAEVLNIPIGT